jgi:hypothetical protein
MANRIAILLAAAAALALLSCAGGVPLISEELEPPPKFIEIGEKGSDKKGSKRIKIPAKKKPEPKRERVLPDVSEDVSFTLIYYVGISKRDNRRAVILDREDDSIEFIPTVRDFEYEILQNVSLEEAVYEAELFMEHEMIIYDYYFKKVLGPSGIIIGYEMRPVYVPWFYDTIDPVLIEYKYKRRMVSVFIKYQPWVSEP